MNDVARCRRVPSGMVMGRCGGRLVQMTLTSGGNKMRRRLWCEKCGLPASDRKD